MAETSTAAKIHCLITVFTIPSLASTPIPHNIDSAKNICIPCAPIITAKTFLANSTSGEFCAKKSAKK